MSISVAIDKWRNILKEAGAEWEYTGGYFCALHTLSGKVSDYYFNSEVVSAAPELLSGLCRDIYLPEIERRKLQIDLVVSYRPFGAAFADELSKKLGVESCFLRSLDSPSLDMEMKRHTRVLVVADDIYSGSSITKIIQAVRAQRGLIAPVLFVFGNF